MRRLPDSAGKCRASIRHRNRTQRRLERRLRVVGRAGVAALDVLVVPDRWPAASSAAVIFRAWPGCTRSSRVDVVISTGG